MIILQFSNISFIALHVSFLTEFVGEIDHMMKYKSEDNNDNFA